jgi:hypothetical protein
MRDGIGPLPEVADETMRERLQGTRAYTLVILT